MNFFGANCQHGPFTDVRFGICDDQPGLPSYVDTANASKWIATVENTAQTPVTFTAIDNDQQNRFFRTYGFRLDAQATVVVV